MQTSPYLISPNYSPYNSKQFEYKYIQNMLSNISLRISNAKDYLKLALQQKNIFQQYQQQTYTQLQIIKSIKFALSSNATDYKHFTEIQHYLSAIIYYLTQPKKDQQTQNLLSLEQQALWITPKYVLYMFQKYLERVMPTNITYYHFIREKQFLTQYVAIKYILIVGFYHFKSKEHILLKMKTSQKLQIFLLLLEWLLTLIYYRCSAIYIKSNCVDPLISQSHLLLSVILGYDGHSILSNLTEIQIKDIVNKMFYVSAFLLAMAIPTKKYQIIQIVINTIRKILTCTTQQKIYMYFPSYLYSNLIGFITIPYTTEIIYRLLIHFVGQVAVEKEAEGESAQQLVNPSQNLNKNHLITECWSILCLMVEQYDLDKKSIKQLILSKMDTIDLKSMDRAFILRIANMQHLDLQQDKIRKFLHSKKQPYIVTNKVIKPELLIKNYHIAMQQFYLQIIIQTARGQYQNIQKNQLWKLITLYNKYQIITLEQYLLILNQKQPIQS